jgi:hypothetical protein
MPTISGFPHGALHSHTDRRGEVLLELRAHQSETVELRNYRRTKQSEYIREKKGD